MSDEILDGRCLCGAVRIAVAAGGADPSVGACHCRMCQRWSGAAFMAFNARAGTVTVTGPLARFASSDFAERAFCPTCGSHLWLRDTTPAGADYELMPGLFADAADWPLRSEVYADCAPAYMRLAGDHRRRTQVEYERDNRSVGGTEP